MAYLYFNRQVTLTKMRQDLVLTAGNAATHLAKLSDHGYAESRRVFASVFEVRVFITDAGVHAFEAYVERLNAFVTRVRGNSPP
jgi:DNA-binding MarR family transcriptional regulator